MHKASVENAGQNLKQKDFPIEMILLANHRAGKTDSSEFFQSPKQQEQSICEEENHEKEKNNNCASQAKVYFLYSMESSSIGVHL